MDNFIDNFIDKAKEKKSHVVVGLDPDCNAMPESFVNEFRESGDIENLIYHFSKNIIDSIYDLVPAIKPQIAFYERYGISGLNAFIKTVEYGKSKDLLVIEDAKRNDIGSTAAAYNDGHLGKVYFFSKEIQTFNVDAITVNPYLGSDGINPFLESVNKFGKGIFVLVKTSNATSVEIQDLKIIDKTGKECKLFEHVAKLVNKWGVKSIGHHGFSSVGAVVGATFPNDANVLRNLMPNTYFLVPGYGAQGGSAKDIISSFKDDGFGAMIAASRSLIYAYKYNTKFSQKDYKNATRDAVARMNNDINQTLRSNNLFSWN